jgi:receptor protein-tyrosine kinase
VKRALASIENCPIVMMVLNKARASDIGGYYGYGYGYGAAAEHGPARGRE